VGFTDECLPADVGLAQVRANGWLFFTPEIPRAYAVAHEDIDVSLVRHRHTSDYGGTIPTAGMAQTNVTAEPLTYSCFC
jgi:hypothetical protein